MAQIDFLILKVSNVYDTINLINRLNDGINAPIVLLSSEEECDDSNGLNSIAERDPVDQVSALFSNSDAKLSGADYASAKMANDCEITRGELVMNPKCHTVTWKGKSVRLTVKEFKILESLIAHPGFVKSRNQLMDAGYGKQVYVDDRNVDSHIKRLRKKMRAVDSSFDAIEALYGVGYRYNST